MAGGGARGPNRFIQPLRHATAYVAVFAGLPLRSLTKMDADLPVPAALRLGESDDVAISLPGSILLRRVLDLINEIGEQRGVAFLPQQQAISGIAVAARAPGFLIVL